MTSFDLSTLTPWFGDLAAGARLTALACAPSLAGALALGVIVALMRTAASRPVRRAAAVYVDAFLKQSAPQAVFVYTDNFAPDGVLLLQFVNGFVADYIKSGAYVSNYRKWWGPRRRCPYCRRSKIRPQRGMAWIQPGYTSSTAGTRSS